MKALNLERKRQEPCMDPEFTTMAVTDWSPEWGTQTEHVTIPEDVWEATQLLQGLRKVARTRMDWTTCRIRDLRERAEKLHASPRVTPETRTAALAALGRLSMISRPRAQVDLKHRCRPVIRRLGTECRTSLFNRARWILEGHGWLTAMETVLTSVEQLLDNPARTRPY